MHLFCNPSRCLATPWRAAGMPWARGRGLALPGNHSRLQRLQAVQCSMGESRCVFTICVRN